MQKGDDIYQEISDFLCQMNDEKKIWNENNKISSEEIKTICYNYGNLFCLFDNMFSILNTKRNTFAEETF